METVTGMLRAALLLPALLLLGCATRSGFEARMQALVGQPEAELVRRLGPPDADVAVQGRRFLRWDRLGIAAPAAIGPGAGFGLGGGPLSGQGITGGPLTAASLAGPGSACSVRFEVTEGRALGFVAEGMGCEAAPPR